MPIYLWIIAGLVALPLLWTQILAWSAERTQPQVGVLHPVAGGAIHYVETGPKDAPVLVLIHGLAGTLQHYTYAISGLLEDDFRLIIVDRPGCGYSTRDRDDHAALNFQAQMIWALLDDLGIKNPTLVGHSLGGAVAASMALERPHGAHALALIAPLTHNTAETPDVFKGLEVRSKGLRRVLAYTLVGPIATFVTKTFLKMAFAPEPYPDDFLIRSGAALGLRPKGFIGASADLVMAKETTPLPQTRYLDELVTPGGVLFGSDDAILDPIIQGKSMTQFGLSFEQLPGRGHVLVITAPQECAAFIRKIATQPPAQAG